MNIGKVLLGIVLGLTGLGLTACLTVSADAPALQKITLQGETYRVTTPISSFSDFILIETQMGNTPPRIVTLNEVVADLSNYDVVFVGEAHGHAANHYVQSKLFAGLYEQHNDLALSMEQFERSQQSVMNQYLAGEIGEETLIHDGKAWENYRSSYRPMVEFAKTKGLPVIAAEVPGNIVSCIGEQGPEFLDDLTGEPRGWVAETLHLQDGAYKKKFYSFLDAAAGHQAAGSLSEEEKEKKKFRSFAAQVSRDDTMAESIYLHMQAHPGRKIMHVNGSFHSAGLLGTVERLLLRNPDISVANIYPVLVDDPAHPEFDIQDTGEGQYILLLYPVPKRFVKMENINAFIARTKGKIDEDRCAYTF